MLFNERRNLCFVWIVTSSIDFLKCLDVSVVYPIALVVLFADADSHCIMLHVHNSMNGQFQPLAEMLGVDKKDLMNECS